MNTANILEKARINQERIIKSIQKEELRPFFSTLDISSRGTMIIGPRGTGKTTFLLNEVSKKSENLYLSLDNLLFQNTAIFDLVEQAYNEGCRYLFLDEVHYRESWSMEVKNIYDSFPQLKILISDSSSLLLQKGTADLSRRFPKSSMPLLSFREYIFLKLGKLLPLFDPIAQYQNTGKVKISSELKKFMNEENMSQLFIEHIKSGQRPIFKEGRYNDRIINVIEKTVFNDIPFFVPSLQNNHLVTLRSIISFLATSAVPTVNIHGLCNQWQIGKDKVYELLKVLEATGVTHMIYNTKTPKGSSKGDKILFQDCSFYFSLDGEIGNVREAYFSSVLKAKGYSVLTSKNEEEYDFLVNNIKFEIGGKNKNRKKSNIVIKDPIDDFYEHSWPLWSLGFMW